jgi:L-rhamnonate dehydratase
MSKWPEYRSDRSSFGLDALGSFAVEVECSDGSVGVCTSLGGVPAAYIVERHLARFIEGKPLTRDGIALAWEQMHKASLYYGRRGLALHALSAIDLSAWDALGRNRQSPIWALLGKGVPRSLPLYATTPRPDVARELGFIGGKLPLPAGPAEGESGLKEDFELAQEMRIRCGDPKDFFLAWDCWMSLDVPFTLKLAQICGPLELRFIEEHLPPDDYWGYADVKRELRGSVLTATGEHEHTRWGFRMLMDMDCVDIIQPDVTWCGGLSELIVIGEMAQAKHIRLVPHASSVYSYQYLATRPDAEFGEFVMFHPAGTEITPMLAPLLVGEPLPVRGTMRLPDTPGFGVELNRDMVWSRPYEH